VPGGDGLARARGLPGGPPRPGRGTRRRPAGGRGPPSGDLPAPARTSRVAGVTPQGAGRAALLDFDLVRTGPREWDLLRTATHHHRLGRHTAREYRDFCAGYGVDVAAWPGFAVAADLSELLQVVWLAEAARRPALTAELRTRLHTLRTGGSRHSWRAV
jgi:hypothetical protein